MVDYNDSLDEAEFRAGVRDWIAANYPTDWSLNAPLDDRKRIERAWHRALYQSGYIGVSWPINAGGRGLPLMYEAILSEELGRAGAPTAPAFVRLFGRSIHRHGTPEQIERFLPPMLNQEVVWCQGFSEPTAGSDISAVRTRAVRDGDRYVVTGQKMWTSGAQYADWCYLVVRTDPDVPRHRGISILLTDLHSPGVTVQPITISNGEPETAEVFFDEVSIPVENRLGDEGHGWEILLDTLSEERGPHAVTWFATHSAKLARATEMARTAGLLDDMTIRERLGQAHVDGQSLRLATLDLLSVRDSPAERGYESSVIKLLWAHAEQNLHHLIMDISGAVSLVVEDEEWLKHYLWSRIGSVYGGTSQIQRNVITKRALAMPAIARGS